MKNWCFAIVTALLCSHAHAQANRAYIEQCVQRRAFQYHIQPEVIAAFIDVESGWNPRAVSSKGARGLMQLMPETARRFGALDPFDPDQNVAAGTRYITSLMWEFRGDLRLVAASYFAGDKWVGRKGLEYRNPEVIAYVEAVRSHYLRRCLNAHKPTGGKR